MLTHRTRVPDLAQSVRTGFSAMGHCRFFAAATTTVCAVMLFNNRPISIEPPNHMILKIEYCEPGVRGNTATNVTKPCKLETGATITGPSFLEQGEYIKVDTRTGEYIERVST